ncbi:MAG: hypothetical protein KDA84_22965, partial [Planctomycetaceae bacterium]|nr:hypothetical protein [Planctomycetaceae bacterium]
LFESLRQFFWAGVDVLRSIIQLFEPNLALWIGLTGWIVFCTGALNWMRLRKIILAGGWIGLLLIALMTILIWGCVDPPADGTHYILGAPLSNFVGKMVYVTGFVCIMLLCGSVQLAIAPQEAEETAAHPVETSSTHH